MRDVIENGPGLDVVPKVLDLVVVDSVEEEGERLEVHQMVNGRPLRIILER